MVEGLSDDALAEVLSAISNPTRLRILRNLTEPRTMNEITVKGHRADATHVVARQTVRVHLDQLIGKGLVLARSTAAGNPRSVEYTVNHQALFALSEEVRNLARLRPLLEPSLPTTKLEVGGGAAAEGPRLHVVRGLADGRTIPLVADARRSWVIGRRRGADVALDYDPFVSSENSVIETDGAVFRISDAGGSRNGTRVNRRRLADGEAHVMRHGDLIEVGRSALLFWQ